MDSAISASIAGMSSSVATRIYREDVTVIRPASYLRCTLRKSRNLRAANNVRSRPVDEA